MKEKRKGEEKAEKGRSECEEEYEEMINERKENEGMRGGRLINYEHWKGGEGKTS